MTPTARRVATRTSRSRWSTTGRSPRRRRSICTEWAKSSSGAAPGAAQRKPRSRDGLACAWSWTTSECRPDTRSCPGAAQSGNSATWALSGRVGAFVPVNCGAIPEQLVEAALFGNVRGAFSGADAPREGFVQAADGGTLFLDEVAELSPSSQTALLRVLQEHEVTPVGATRPVCVDLRIVSATHRDLDAFVDDGRFREDLHARLAGFVGRLPALRDRREDLGLLAAALLRRHAGESRRLPAVPPARCPSDVLLRRRAPGRAGTPARSPRRQRERRRPGPRPVAPTRAPATAPVRPRARELSVGAGVERRRRSRGPAARRRHCVGAIVRSARATTACCARA